MTGVLVDVTATNRGLRVLRDTWGHLAAAPGCSYHGVLVFAISEWNSCGITPVTSDFQDLPSSPWFWDALWTFLGTQDDREPGVYRFSGTYTDGVFKGDVAEIDITSPAGT